MAKRYAPLKPKFLEREELLMRNRGTVQLMTLGQMKELASAMLEGIPVNLSAERVQYLIGRKRKLAEEIKKILAGATSDFGDLLTDWQKFYADLFGLNLDFSGLYIPEKQDGFDRFLVVAEGMTPNRLFAKCQELFPCWRFVENLDVIASDRDPKDGAYAIWVRDRQEADEELKSKSANMLKEEGIATETLPERLIHELKFFKETKKHLDEKNVTLCTGSRDPDGCVPYVDWVGVCMDVFWYCPGYRFGSLRARAAIS